MNYFSNEYQAFFRQLRKNNSKEWFHANKQAYTENVDGPFTRFLTHFLERIAADHSYIIPEAKKYLFRLNKDMRFSQDRLPYKLHRSALISVDGTRSKECPGIYLEFSGSQFLIRGGCFKLKPSQTNRIKALTVEFYTRRTQSQLREQFQLKNSAPNSVYVETVIPIKDVLGENLLEIVFDHWTVLAPFLARLNEGVTNGYCKV